MRKALAWIVILAFHLLFFSMVYTQAGIGGVVFIFLLIGFVRLVFWAAEEILD